MIKMKVLAFVMFVMAYSLAVTRFTASQGSSTCSGYEPLISQCMAYLIDESRTPSSRCCDAARVAFQSVNNPQAIENFCSCLVDAGSYLHLVPSQEMQLPIYCNIEPSFDMKKCIYG
ncbi:hypothetical protein Fmac_026827 [Flemingia macrophylla]|uniref:Bifunctional inhibitor/plant lipid transfer protein/seed storage helical domain-containing protein n=1 Tax=Flemingia macrophylla TaxID=520843 RepID=A0ABD1LG89_9FABA